MTDAKKPAANTATGKNAEIPATIYAALAYFQSIVPPIAKGDTAGTGNFKYKYGSLPDIMETIKPHMAAAGLGFTQPIETDEDRREVIRTILFHVQDDRTIESTIVLPSIEFKGMNVVQSKGSVITYLRRYSLMSILGIVTDDDDNDAAGTTQPKGATTNAPKTGEKPAPTADSKPWLNPEVDGKPNPKWNEALKYLADGGTIEKVKTKYKIGKNNEERLLNDALAFDDLPFDRQAVDEATVVDESTDDPVDVPNTLFDHGTDEGTEVDNPDHY